MDTKYTGMIEGFQVITTMGNNVTLHPSTARNFNNILKKLNEVFDVHELKRLREVFADHTTSITDPHGIDIENLPLEIMTTLYDEWIREGNRGTFDDFSRVFFHTIETATTDEQLIGDSPELAMTVRNFHRLLYLFHTGPIYTHVPIMEKLFVGNPLYKHLVYSVNSIFSNEVSAVNNKDYGLGTYFINIDSNPVIIDTEYVNISNNSTDEDILTISRNLSHNNRLRIRISDGTNEDIINITISHHSYKFAIVLLPESILIGRLVDTEPNIYSLTRATDYTKFNSITKKINTKDIKQFMYYSHIANNDEIAFLIT